MVTASELGVPPKSWASTIEQLIGDFQRLMAGPQEHLTRYLEEVQEFRRDPQCETILASRLTRVDAEQFLRDPIAGWAKPNALLKLLMSPRILQAMWERLRVEQPEWFQKANPQEVDFVPVSAWTDGKAVMKVLRSMGREEF
jgi:hypothetical protein